MTSAPRRPGPRLHDLHVSPRALVLAASIAWRHLAADPVRAVVLAQRVLPPPLRGGLRLAGPYGRAAVAWGAGDRAGALAGLDRSPRRLAAFALAVDQPDAAAGALQRLPEADPARPVLAARLAWRQGRLTDGLDALTPARGRRARRLHAQLAAERAVLTPPAAARPPRARRRRGATMGRVLHLVGRHGGEVDGPGDVCAVLGTDVGELVQLDCVDERS